MALLQQTMARCLSVKSALTMYMHKKGHTTLSHEPSGLTLSKTYSFLGASSDGIVMDPPEPPSDGLLEIKCPFSIDGDVCCWSPFEMARKSSFCLAHLDDGALQLKRTRAYYSQVQRELVIMEKKWADFVIWTQGSGDHLHVERIYADAAFWLNTCMLTLYSYTTAMVPELLLRHIQRGLPQLESEADNQ